VVVCNDRFEMETMKQLNEFVPTYDLIEDIYDQNTNPFDWEPLPPHVIITSSEMRWRAFE
jgi:hypothetical protein